MTIVFKKIHERILGPSVGLVSAVLVAALLAGCGGGGDSTPTQYNSTVISGTVATGAPVANAQVHILCLSPDGGWFNFFTTTDANGVFSKTLSTAVAPCTLDVVVDSAGTKLYSYIQTLSGGKQTVNITPLTSAVLSTVMDTIYIGSAIQDNSGLQTLQTRLAQGKADVAWATMKQQLQANKYLTADDLSVIATDPVSSPLQSDPDHLHKGYDGLLDQLTAKNLNVYTLRALGSQTYAKLSGTVAAGAMYATAPQAVAAANKAVYTFCTAADGSLEYYTTSTDGNGDFLQPVAANSAPCLLISSYQESNGTGARLQGYVASFTSGSVRANVTPLTNGMLAALIGVEDISSRFNKVSAADMALLKSSLTQEKISSTWVTMKQGLSFNSVFPSIDATAINDPATDVFSLAAGATNTGYAAVLASTGSNYIESYRLGLMASGASAVASNNRFAEVAGTNGAEVLDKLTGTIWQRCVVGMVWNGTTCTATASLLSWNDAVLYAQNSPLSSAPNAKAWGLPTRSMLRSLLEKTANPAVNPTWFPASVADWTWTSEPYPGYVAHVVHMGTRQSAVGESTDYLAARLAR